MVVKMMRWPPWPLSFLSTKFQVKLVVIGLDGLHLDDQDNFENSDSRGDVGRRRLTAEVRWKGPKSKSTLGTFRRRIVRTNCTKESAVVLLDTQKQQPERQGEGEIEQEEEEEEIVEDNNCNNNKRMAKVEWNEEFLSVCTLTSNNNKDEHKSNFHPWEISFRIFNGPSPVQSNEVSVIGTALLNLAEFASAAENKETEICIPLLAKGGTTMPPVSLRLAISLLEMKAAQLSSGPDVTPKAVIPAPLHQRDLAPAEKDEVSALRAGLRRVRMLKDFVSKSKKTNREDEGSDGRYSVRSDDAEYIDPFDTDSMDQDLENKEEDRKETSNIRKSFSYGTLASANFVGGSFYTEMRTKGDQEDWIYYSHRRSDVGCSHKDEATTCTTDLSSSSTIKKSVLPWKRKRFFRSPKSKGEPLLKCYREEGGDDIDFDRRQLSSSDESLGGPKLDEDAIANRLSSSDFGDDNFVIGSWEMKEVVSRDACMKLCSQVFFATIDQRSERAAGESACTALVAVIANWFQANLQVMPIKSQFDRLIREGSLEWRNLCENETYRQSFPDKHFDLETVILAKIRPLSVVPSKSFIGFFHPDAIKDDERDVKNTDNNSNLNCFEFLDGAMSFDSIWDEISRAAAENKPSDGSPHIYIVSWNDHFFILKVECDAYYIIDTLGERLYEGCDQAYILKFDVDTSIRKMREDDKSSTGNQQVGQHAVVEKELSGEEANNNDNVEKDEIVCKGKESCKEYIKNFLASIPIRELQVDMKKGLPSSTPIHHRLQIEFHYTQLSKEAVG